MAATAAAAGYVKPALDYVDDDGKNANMWEDAW